MPELLNPEEVAGVEFRLAIKELADAFISRDQQSGYLPVFGPEDHLDIIKEELAERGFGKVTQLDPSMPRVESAHLVSPGTTGGPERFLFLVKHEVGDRIWEFTPKIAETPQPWHPCGPSNPERLRVSAPKKAVRTKSLFAALEEDAEDVLDFTKPTPDSVWWDGQVLYGPAIAYDLESNINSDNTQGQPVLGSIGGRDKDGEFISYLVDIGRIVECFEFLIENNPKADWVGYNNSGFDHVMLDRRVPGFRERISEKYWWDMVFQTDPNRGRVIDLMIMVMLHDLANNLGGDMYRPRCADGTPKKGAMGFPPVPEEWALSGVGAYTLQSCMWRFLRKKILKDARRENYGQFLNKAREMPWPYAEYALLDAVFPLELYDALIADPSSEFNQSVASVLEETRAIKSIPYFGEHTHNIQYAGAYALANITNNGFPVNAENVEKFSKVKRREALKHIQTVADAGFAQIGDDPSGDSIEVERLFEYIQKTIPNSPRNRRRGDWLEYYGLRPKPWEVLEDLYKMDDPLVRDYFLYRFLQKESTDIQNYMPRFDGRLNPKFWFLLATGRTSCSKPNVQQVKSAVEFRSLFETTPGNRLITIDYGQIEMATWAQVCIARYGFSQVGKLMNLGVDPHIYTGMYFFAPERADEWVPMVLSGEYEKGALMKALANLLDVPEKEIKNARNRAKPINFGLPGGLGWRKLQETALKSYNVVFTEEESKEAIERHKQIYPEYGIWMKEQSKFDTKTSITYYGDSRPADWTTYGGCVTITGRRRAYLSYNAWHNTQFQGLAADGAKLALLEAVRRGIKIVNFVHDEIVAEAPDEVAEEHAAILQEVMRSQMERVIPDVKVTADVARQGENDPEPGKLPRIWMKD